VILLVSMARPQDYDEKCAHTELKRKFEKLTGTPALLQHYSEVTPQLVDSLPLKAIFISGSGARWRTEVDPRKLDGLYDVVIDTEIPIHGACAGHQLLGFFFNAEDWQRVDGLDDEHMRPLGPDEAVSVSDVHPGMFVEQGMFEIEITQQDPVFEGFTGSLVVRESHACEVKTLPPNFIHLARNHNCELQAMRHRDRLIYGTQFHPEAWTENHPDGKRFMQNFFRIAGLID
jgi:GMP synthase-like glutamine amidotransferase